MPLTCDCDIGGDSDWYYTSPEDYQNLMTKRRQRCKSCGQLIELGALCIEFERTRPPKTEVECRIYDEDDSEAISLGSYYQCEACADQWFNLDALGFCVGPEDDMREMLRGYIEMNRRV